MNSALSEVKKIVTDSALSVDDKQLLIDRLGSVEPIIPELLLKILKGNPDMLETLLLSLKEKIQAQGDERALEKIAKREEKQVESILK